MMDHITRTARPNWMTWVILVCTVIVAIWTIGAGLAQFLAADKEHTPAVEQPLHRPAESSSPVPSASRKSQDQLATPEQTETTSNKQNSPDLSSKEMSANPSTSPSLYPYLDPQSYYLRHEADY